MEAKGSISNSDIKKILSVIDSKSEKEKCTICGEKLFPAVLESWKGDTLIDFKIQNGFCAECRLFQFEPEETAQLYFEKPKLRKIYERSLNSFI